MFMLYVLAQVASAAAPPPGAAAPADAERAAVLAPIQTWFDGIAAGDAARIRAQLRIDGGGGATVVSTNADGATRIRHLAWEEILANVKPGERRLEERFVGVPNVAIDGDIAMVWGAFTFLVDGRVSHCGVDHFDLIREHGRWRVQNVTWSQRVSGCDSSAAEIALRSGFRRAPTVQ